MSDKQKILAIVGPTASGKSDLAIQLAKKFNGEVVSADSRQIYRGLDIATNKVTLKEARGVPHHMIDVWNPKKKISVADYKTKAQKIISGIIKRGNLPILAGGTGFYIDAIVYGMSFPEVFPNETLRKQLETKPLESLLKTLQRLDPERLKTVDQKNKRRVIRAIEIAESLDGVPKKVKEDSPYDALVIGLKLEKDELKKNIEESVRKRMLKGMAQEAKKLHEKGLSWKRMRELGLEYRLLADHHQGKIKDRQELENRIVQEDWKYAKRQMTWFKKDKKINWFSPEEVADVEEKVRQFLDG